MRRRLLFVPPLVALLVGCSHSDASRTPSSPSSDPAPQVRPVSQPTSAAILSLATGRALAFVRSDQPITGATADGHGGWYIGGGFTTVNGRSRPHLAHILAGGALDPSWRPQLAGRAALLGFLSLAVTRSDVIVAGGFHEVSGRPRPGLAAFDRREGSLDTGWVPPASCADGMWRIVASGQRSFAGTACGAGACVLALDARGRSVPDWSAEMAAVGEIPCADDLAIGGGTIYVTGGFTAIGGENQSWLGGLRASDGAPLRGFRPHGGPCSGPEHAVAVGRRFVFSGGDVCPIAAVDRASGAPRWRVRRRNNASTLAMATSASAVFIGGEFGRIKGANANGFAGFNQADGRLLRTWHPPVGGAIVYALAVSGPRLLIAGSDL
jgi:trimeric autotransporter adhesin